MCQMRQGQHRAADLGYLVLGSSMVLLVLLLCWQLICLHSFAANAL